MSLVAPGFLTRLFERLGFHDPIPSSGEIANRTELRQVSILMRQSPVMAVTNLINSALLAIVLWKTAWWPFVVAWLVLIYVSWVPQLVQRVRKRNRPPPSRIHAKTVRKAILRSALAGALWGIAGFVLFPAHAPVQQLILAFVLGGMSAGAVASMSSFPAACYAFILSSMTPLAASFLRGGEQTSMIMGAMIIVYTAAMLVVARNGYQTFLDGIRTELENERLLDRLSATHSRLVDAVEGVPAGIVFCDADDQVLLCNSLFKEWVGADADRDMKPGMTFEMVLEHAASAVLGPASKRAHRAWVRSALKRHRNPGEAAEIEFADGRVALALERKTQDGGTISVFTDVTVLKEHEAEIDAQSALMRATLDNMAQGLVAFDGDLKILAANSTAGKMLDLPEDLLAIGESFESVIRHSAARGDYGPGDVDKLTAKYRKLASGRRTHTFEREMANGSVLEVRGKRLDEGGFVVTYSDITEHKRAEDRIQRAEQQMRDAIDSVSDGFVLFDASDRLVLVNEQYREMYSFLGDEVNIVGRDFEDLIKVGIDSNSIVAGPAQADRDDWLEQRVARHRNPPEEPFEQQLADGRWIMVSERRTREGGIVGIHTDVTALKRAEMRLRDAVESLPDAFALYDADDRLLIFNEKYREYYSESADLIRIGVTFEEILRNGALRGQYAEAEGRVEEFLRERLALHRSPGGVIEQKLSDGRWLRIEERKTREGGIVGVRADVTALKQREEALEVSRSELNHRVAELETMQQRLEAQGAELRQLAQHLSQARDVANAANKAKSDFLANMSHELRTPLNAIIGFSEVMSNEMLGPLGEPAYKQYAGDIHESGSHLLSLINDILDLSKIEAGRMELHEERVDVAATVAATLRIIGERAVAASVSLTTEIEPDLPLLFADERAIKQIMLNLLSNAVKFTTAGGSVLVAAEVTKDGDLAIRVSDTGIGMDEDDIEKALSPFGQVDSSLARQHAGTGLGLPLVKSMTEVHDGTLKVESERAVGTTVTVIMPATRVLGAEPDVLTAG